MMLRLRTGNAELSSLFAPTFGSAFVQARWTLRRVRGWRCIFLRVIFWHEVEILELGVVFQVINCVLVLGISRLSSKLFSNEYFFIFGCFFLLFFFKLNFSYFRDNRTYYYYIDVVSTKSADRLTWLHHYRFYEWYPMKLKNFSKVFTVELY